MPGFKTGNVEQTDLVASFELWRVCGQQLLSSGGIAEEGDVDLALPVGEEVDRLGSVHGEE